MRQKAIFFVVAALASMSAWALEKNEKGVYQIYTPQDLVEFSAIVNAGESSAKAKLNADLDMSEIDNFEPIGKHIDPEKGNATDINFTGSFNGANHIICNLTVETTDGSEGGLFGRLIDATIKNLGIVNADISTNNVRGGVLAGIILRGSVTNCFVAGEIGYDTGNEGFGALAEAFLQNYGGSGSPIQNCYTTFDKVVNTLDGQLINCYQGDEALSKAATGELCYQLNHSMDTPAFFQTLGEDEFPVLDSSHGTVYAKADEFRCDGTGLGDVTFTNEDVQGAIPAHTPGADGICQVCGSETVVLEPVDGWYNVSTPAELCFISRQVKAGNQGLNFRLTADIDLKDIENFPPIGRYSDDAGYGQTSFKGTFDGQGFVVSNLKVNVSEPIEAGLFSRGERATLMNVGVINATIVSTGQIGGNGIRVGVLAGEAAWCTVKNVYTTGEISLSTGHEQKCGIAGEAHEANLSNCYTTFEGDLAKGNITSITNCYGAADVATKGETGELCFLLNVGQSEPAFFQTLGEDKLPVLKKDHKQVYAQATEYRCDGMGMGQVTYTNDAQTPVLPPHNFDGEGYCEVCGVDVGFIEPAADRWFEVRTPEQLRYMSRLVNSGHPEHCIRLMNDIDMSGIRNYQPMGYFHDNGATTAYKAIFDGQNHIIYNLFVEVSDGQEAGLFGRVNDNGDIRNLGVVNATIINNGGTRAGVLAGEIHARPVTNCFTAGNIEITTSHQQKGGISGEAASATLTNCYTTYGVLTAGAAAENNCYAGVSEEAKSGELAMKLGAPYRQNLGEEEYPVLDQTHGIVTSISAAGYATFYTSLASVSLPEGVEAFTGKVGDNGKLWLTAVEGSMPANTGVVIKGAQGYYSMLPAAATSKTVCIDFTAMGFENQQDLTESTITEGDLDVNFDAGTNQNAPKFFSNGNAVRFYGSNRMSIYALGQPITKIEFSFVEDYTPTEEDAQFEVDGNSAFDLQTFTWTGKADQVTLIRNAGKGHYRITAITVTYGEEGEGYCDPENQLVGTDAVIAKETIAGNYLLAKPEGKEVGFYLANDEADFPAGRAYLPAGCVSGGVKSIFLNGVTGIEELTADDAQETTEIFDLSGRRVVKAAKGVYIINGKKVLK